MPIIIALCTIIPLAFATLVTAQPDTQPLDLRISWTRPTHNTDGTVLTDLAGYYICLSLSEPIPADFPTRDRALMTETCTVVVDITVLDAEAAEHSIQVPVNSEDILYARIAAYDTSGNVSGFSEEAFANFDFLSPDGATILNLNLKVKKGRSQRYRLR